MVLDVVCSIFQTAVTLSHICYKQVFYERLGISTEVQQYSNLLVKITRELYFASQYLLVDDHWITVIKWIYPGYHFVGKDT